MKKAKLTYSEKLLDPRWQKRKTEIQTRDEFTCQTCRRRDITLNVHHRFYIKKAEPWDYPDEALVLLCSECHTKAGTSVALFDETFKAAFLPVHLRWLAESFSRCTEVSNLAKCIAMIEMLEDGLLTEYLYERRLRKVSCKDSGYAEQLSSVVHRERTE